MNNAKKSYSKPELIVHGDVEKITLQAGAKNADTPQGVANTAFPAGAVAS